MPKPIKRKEHLIDPNYVQPTEEEIVDKYAIEQVELGWEKRPVKDIMKEADDVDTIKISQELLVWAAENVTNYIDSDTSVFKLDMVFDETTRTKEIYKLQGLYRAIPEESTLIPQELIDNMDNDAGFEAFFQSLPQEQRDMIEEVADCKMKLDDITEKIFDEMNENTVLLKKLFNAMSFFYQKMDAPNEKRVQADELDTELRRLAALREATATEEVKEKLTKEIQELVDRGFNLVEFQEVEGIADVIKFEYESFSMGVKVIKTVPGEEAEVLKDYVVPEGFSLWVEIACRPVELPLSMF